MDTVANAKDNIAAFELRLVTHATQSDLLYKTLRQTNKNRVQYTSVHAKMTFSRRTLFKGKSQDGISDTTRNIVW